MTKIQQCRKSFKSFFKPSVLISIIIFLVCIIGLLYINRSCNDCFYATHIIAPILTSVIAAIVVALTIEIKSHVASLQNIIVEAFTSNSFLEKLPDERLQEIRSNAITQMHKQKYPYMQKGLMNMDKDIFTALMNPYYETYRETAIYHKTKLFAWNPDNEVHERVLFRSVNVQYTIKSPTADSVESEADLSIKKCIQKPIENDSEEIIRRIFSICHFYVSIDGAERVDIKDMIGYDIKKLDVQDEYYNTSVKLVYAHDSGNGIKRMSKDNKNSGIFVEYKKSVKVEIDYEIFLPIEDNHFTNRLKYPTKSFRIDCICHDDNNVRLYGQLLGTFTDNSKIKISHPKDNIISIESFDWLLPRNGVFIILCEKTHAKDRT